MSFVDMVPHDRPGRGNIETRVVNEPLMNNGPRQPCHLCELWYPARVHLHRAKVVGPVDIMADQSNPSPFDGLD